MGGQMDTQKGMQNGILSKSDFTPQNILLVSDLIDQYTKEWDTKLISQIFPPNEAEMIQAIPLTKTTYDDVRIWEHEKRGSFTVKSCYHMLQSNSEAHHQERAEAEIKMENQMWKRIWAANIPSKIRIFTWRVCHEIILVFIKLYQ